MNCWVLTIQISWLVVGAFKLQSRSRWIMENGLRCANHNEKYRFGLKAYCCSNYIVYRYKCYSFMHFCQDLDSFCHGLASYVWQSNTPNIPCHASICSWGWEGLCGRPWGFDAVPVLPLPPPWPSGLPTLSRRHSAIQSEQR